MSQNRVLPSSVTAIPVEEVEDISCPEICPFLSPFRALFSSSSFVPFRIFHRFPLSIVLSHSHLSLRNYLSLSLNSFYPLYQQNANTIIMPITSEFNAHAYVYIAYHFFFFSTISNFPLFPSVCCSISSNVIIVPIPEFVLPDSLHKAFDNNTR